MPVKLALALSLVTLSLVTLALAGRAAAAPCAPQTSAAADVAATLTAMYAAAKADDLDGFHAVTTPDFYAFESGRRVDGDGMMQIVKAAHAAGTRFEWSVTEPKVEADCRLAQITYVNVGSVTTNGANLPVTWLESAALRYDGTRWRIDFFSSTRAPQAK